MSIEEQVRDSKTGCTKRKQLVEDLVFRSIRVELSERAIMRQKIAFTLSFKAVESLVVVLDEPSSSSSSLQDAYKKEKWRKEVTLIV